MKNYLLKSCKYFWSKILAGENYKLKNGFILLLSLLVSSVILAAGLSVTRIIIRQVSLASIQKDSQIAFFAADAGVECGRYWREGPPVPFVSGNSSCNGEPLFAKDINQTATNDLSGTNDVKFFFNTGDDVSVPKNCVKITVCKDNSGVPGGDCTAGGTNGKIVARGYNVECGPDGNPTAGRVVERKLVYIYR